MIYCLNCTQYSLFITIILMIVIFVDQPLEIWGKCNNMDRELVLWCLIRKDLFFITIILIIIFVVQHLERKKYITRQINFIYTKSSLNYYLSNPYYPILGIGTILTPDFDISCKLFSRLSNIFLESHHGFLLVHSLSVASSSHILAEC